MRRTLRSFAFAAAMLALANTSRAEAVTDQILAHASFFETSGCSLVKVDLNLQARYVRHYPFDHGTELRIELVPAGGTADERNFLFRRESIRPPDGSEGLITSIVYEGNAAARPTLTFFFRQDLTFKVGQGGDFRSLVVAIAKPDGSGACEPAYPETE